MLGKTSLLRTAARPLSSAAALPMTPPIPLFGASGRYASALYAAAAKKGELTKVETDLKKFSEIMASSPNIKAFVESPSVPRDKKAAGIKAMMTEVGACESTKNAFLTMADNARLGDAGKLSALFADLMVAARGEVTAKVTVATEPGEKERAAIRKQIDGYLEAGQKDVEMEIVVNPGLISGMTVEIGDKFIDMSAATQLKKLQSLLKMM
jgi:F-type H+-transporting ATPase subunit O